jgi:AmpD protein
VKLRLDAAGSPHSSRRPTAILPAARDLAVIHHIGSAVIGGPGIVELFTNRLDPAAHPYYSTLAGMNVSSHFLIRRDGALWQFVPCAERAWHAGESSWKGRARCNDFSIGIELEGTGDAPFTAAQYRQLSRLTRALRAHYPIRDIVGPAALARAGKRSRAPLRLGQYRALLKVRPMAAKAPRKLKRRSAPRRK